MNYSRIKQVLGALMTAAGLISIIWVILGLNVQGMGLIAVAGLLVFGGLVHLFMPGEEPKSVLSKLVEEVKDVESE